VTLKVIGTGFGRTGTQSLKFALEQIGFGPCYHMMEVFPRPQHVGEWAKAARGERIDWDTLFQGFTSTVDWPSTRFWHELIARYPDAKVIHTERDPEVWYKSFSSTIQEALGHDRPPEMAAWSEMVQRILTEQTFGGDYRKENVLKVYAAHNAEVRRAIPAARRLDYDIAQGWEPLCRFLGVSVPATPFPKTNSTAEFRARWETRRGKP
jgi:Sulfotransferase domain